MCLQEITLADIFHVAYGSLVPAAGSNVIESKPNVDRYVSVDLSVVVMVNVVCYLAGSRRCPGGLPGRRSRMASRAPPKNNRLHVLVARL
jgi:hypothetical protein